MSWWTWDPYFSSLPQILIPRGIRMCYMCDAGMPHSCPETGAFENYRAGQTYQEDRPVSFGAGQIREALQNVLEPRPAFQAMPPEAPPRG